MSYKILKLISENFLKIKFVEIVPESNIVVIAGQNGQGKSSVLNVICSTLGGVDNKSFPTPIHNGTDYAQNTIDLGDYIITRNWTANDKTYLKVVSKDGTKFKNPQQLLDKIIGDLSFDPLEFCDYEPKKQVEVLLNLVGLKESLSGIDTEKKKIYDERVDINREIVRLDSYFKNSSAPEQGLPNVEYDTQDLVIQLNQANGMLRDNQNARNELMNIEVGIDNIEKELLRLKKRICDLEQQLPVQQVKRDQLRNKIIPDPDVNEITSQIAKCHEINNKIQKAKEYYVEKTEYDSKLTASEYCTERLRELENDKIELLKNANFPIQNLSFDENGVLFEGVPFVQCSSSQKLKVSIAIAMALNPELRVIRIMNGNLLDKHGKKYIKEIAEKNDFQVWVEEVVNEKGIIGFYIEDGEVK